MIPIDDPTLPERPIAELRAASDRHAIRFRRRRRRRIAGVGGGAIFAVVALLSPSANMSTVVPAGGSDAPAVADIETMADAGDAVGDVEDVTDGSEVRQAYSDLKKALPPDVPIVGGGEDGPREPSATPLAKAKAKILFARDEGTFEVLVDGTGLRRVETVRRSFARWSPDGHAIAYYDDGDLRLLDLNTGQATVLFASTVGDATWGHEWMPDGNSIVFQRTYKAGLKTVQELWLVEVATRRLRQVRPNTSEPMVGPGEPSVGPDGRILYVCPADGTAKLCLTDADGSDLGVVPNTAQFFNFEWSPDGRWIAAAVFTGTEGATSAGLVVQRLDGSDRRVLLPDRAGKPYWLPDGSRVAVSLLPPPPEEYQAVGDTVDSGGDTPCTQSPCAHDTGIWSVKLDGSDPRPIVTGERDHLLDARAA